jgi:L-ascorbate metabolism protein UlaG (beta-lactamase superfamily)
MKISKHIHSCILVEENNERILIDPGPFSFIEGLVKPEEFTGINAILITHKHGDHYDVNAIKEILENNSGAKVFANKVMVEELEKSEISAEVFESGEKKIGNFSVSALPAEHQPLPSPVPPNTAFLINSVFLHPGDSFDKKIFDTKARILALPVAAPWLNIMESLKFVSNYKPSEVIPIHDGHIKDFFTAGQYKNWDKLLRDKNIKFHPLQKPGEGIDV